MAVTKTEKKPQVVNLSTIEISQVESKKKAEILRPQPNLYMKGEIADLAQLIWKFFFGVEPTYFDEACTKQQTGVGKRRSIEDLFMVTKTYFPKISYLKLEERVKALYQERDGFSLDHDFCNQVKREVHVCRTLKTPINWVRKYLPNNLVVK